MLKQQFKQAETELNIPQGVEDFDPGFQTQQPQNQRQLQGMVSYNYPSGKQGAPGQPNQQVVVFGTASKEPRL